jgi:hypothetical protein
VDLLELLRESRRSAGDMRKVFLALYGLLLLVPLALLVLAAGRTALSGSTGSFREEVLETFMWPVQSTGGFFSGAFQDGNWGLMALIVIGIWLIATLVGSFFGLMVTRMAAVELTCKRRAEVSEALRFARGHWYWGFLTPAGLAFGAMALLALGALLVSLGHFSDLLIVVTAPMAFVLVLGAIVLLLGLLAGGMLAWPAIATEWSDAFDAATRVYGYSFAHAYRVFLYRTGAGLAFVGAAVSRGVRAVLVLGLFFLVLRVGLGAERTGALVDTVLLEPPQGLPLPQTIAAWMLLSCCAIYLTLLVARLLVFRIVLRQAVYLLLRLRIDKVPLDNIDGYRPDDSDYDPTAQGFELVEVEEELRTE